MTKHFTKNSFFSLVVSPNLQRRLSRRYDTMTTERKKERKRDKKKDESSNGHQTIVRGVQDSQTTRSITRRLLESTKTQTTTRFSDRNFTGDDSERRRRRRWKERTCNTNNNSGASSLAEEECCKETRERSLGFLDHRRHAESTFPSRSLAGVASSTTTTSFLPWLVKIDS